MACTTWPIWAGARRDSSNEVMPIRVPGRRLDAAFQVAVDSRPCAEPSNRARGWWGVPDAGFLSDPVAVGLETLKDGPIDDRQSLWATVLNPVTTAMHEYDKCGKYQIQHHGDSILRMARAPAIVSWKPVQTELVQHRRLPDGLLEVLHLGEVQPDTYLLEISTYPDARVASQVMDDIALSWLSRHVLPEVVVLFLYPRGNVVPVESIKLNSRLGCTTWDASWRIIKLWEVPAEDLLATVDVGVVPWVPLAKLDGPPEPIIRECRARIDKAGSPVDKENLLAVTQYLARLRYNDEALFEILGGRKAMIESPLMQELRKEWTDEGMREGMREGEIKALMTVLVRRFGVAAESLETEIRATGDDARLKDMIEHAATCRSLASFRKKLTA